MLRKANMTIALVMGWTMLAAGCFDQRGPGPSVVQAAATPASSYPLSRRIHPPASSASDQASPQPTKEPVLKPWPTPTPRLLLGLVSTLIGPDPEMGTPFNRPNALTIDPDGNVYVSDTYSYPSTTVRIRRVTPNGEVSTLAGLRSGYLDADWLDAEFAYTTGVALDYARNVYVADQGNHCIRKVTPLGEVSTLAGGVSGYFDGTGTSARFNNPTGVAVDCRGNVYVADTGNHRIRKITPEGEVTTLAGGEQGLADGAGANAMFNYPYGVTVGASGVLYVTDQYNDCIRKVSPKGEVTTLAGGISSGTDDGIGAEAQFYRPYGIAADRFGRVYVADGSGKLRQVMADGAVTTLSFESLGPVISVATDPQGRLYTIDRSAKRVQVIE